MMKDLSIQERAKLLVNFAGMSSKSLYELNVNKEYMDMKDLYEKEKNLTLFCYARALIDWNNFKDFEIAEMNRPERTKLIDKKIQDYKLIYKDTLTIATKIAEEIKNGAFN